MTSSHDVPTPEGLDNWSGDVSLLPNITWLDITSYLIKTPSIFSKASLRAYKSLEAYDYFVCGHVQDCFYHPISEDDIFCFIKTQVLPSQRQAEKTVMYDVWVCVHKQEGWVLSASCTCMAGLGKACSHVGALLFKIEAACRLNIRDATAPTSLLCSWNVSRKSVEPAPLKHITFDRPKKTSLPQDNRPTSYKKHYSTKHPELGDYPLSDDELRKIYHTDPDIALFNSSIT